LIVIHSDMESPGSTESAQAARVFRAGRAFSHLCADTEDELRAYAKAIGLNMRWIQNPGNPQRVHFDVTGAWLTRIRNDDRVVNMTMREWVDWYSARNKRYEVLG
jgi:hypothetical protein